MRFYTVLGRIIRPLRSKTPIIIIICRNIKAVKIRYRSNVEKEITK